MQNSCSSCVMLSYRNVEGSFHFGVQLLHDKAPVHKSVVAQQVVRDCEFVQLNHPEYSQDLGPSDYFLFRMKFHLCGTWFTDDESLKVTVAAWFVRQDGKLFFKV